MTRAAAVRQIDVARAIRGAERAGMKVGRVEIDPATGKIIITTGAEADATDARNAGDVVAERLRKMGAPRG
ncbi:MAG: hypothetical protein K2Y29_17995 [Beijerinckiaceae bacterium]|nr:hypothetical protein [Beijerinckiaceae bacterium]